MRQDSKPIQIEQFPGLQTNLDALDIQPGGATVQLNVTSIKQGQLEVRKGMRPVDFEDD